jgi:hypothetical protein
MDWFHYKKSNQLSLAQFGHELKLSLFSSCMFTRP